MDEKKLGLRRLAQTEIVFPILRSDFYIIRCRCARLNETSFADANGQDFTLQHEHARYLPSTLCDTFLESPQIKVRPRGHLDYANDAAFCANFHSYYANRVLPSSAASCSSQARRSVVITFPCADSSIMRNGAGEPVACSMYSSLAREVGFSVSSSNFLALAAPLATLT